MNPDNEFNWIGDSLVSALRNLGDAMSAGVGARQGLSYEVWFVPTPRGRQAFGWTAYPVSRLRRYDCLSDAQEAIYFEECDEPSPDRRDYMGWEVVELRAGEEEWDSLRAAMCFNADAECGGGALGWRAIGCAGRCGACATEAEMAVAAGAV